MTGLRPLTQYFLVRSSIKDEKEHKEKIGMFFTNANETYMAYNTQYGEIMAIGKSASEFFPEAKIGHILLFHHFVQGSSVEESKEDHLVDWDDEYRYYVVTAYSCNGKNNETYGVWDGEKIIPNKEYVFLKIVDEKQSLKETGSGLVVFDNWNESRESKEAKMDNIKKEVQSLSKSGTNKPHIQQGILAKEDEMNKISANINHKEYKPFKVAYANKELSEHFSRDVVENDTLYMLNIACSTIFKFQNHEYIITKTNFIGVLLN